MRKRGIIHFIHDPLGGASQRKSPGPACGMRKRGIIHFIHDPQGGASQRKSPGPACGAFGFFISIPHTGKPGSVRK